MRVIFRVLETQEMEGGQRHEVLASRTKFDWMLPDLLSCDSILKGAARIYLDGDKKRGLPRHQVPVWSNKPSSGGLSKVIERHKGAKPGLSFLSS